MTRTACAGVVLVAATLAGCGPAIAGRIDDGVITTRVRTALLYDPTLATRRLAVVTVDGIVTLAGAVRSAEEAEQAVKLARAVDGVRDVRSQLTVGTSAAGAGPALESRL